MLILLPVFLLLLTAGIMAWLNWRRPNYSYYWLWAAGGTIFAWISVWVLRANIPSIFILPFWRFEGLLPPPPGLIADAVSWPFALALVTMCLAVILTDVGRASETGWIIWAGDLGITALGVLAVLSGSPLTLVMAWTLIDLLEIMILLRQVDDQSTRRRVIAFFSTNMLGIALVLWAMMIALGGGAPMTFSLIPTEAVVVLIIAVGLRMGVVPLQVVFLQDVHQQRGQGTLLRMIPPASSLVLLVRIANTDVPQFWEWTFLVFALLAAGYGAAAWARAGGEIQGRIYWILGVTGLAFASALRSRPEATLAWSLALLYPGTALFLASIRERRWWPIGLFGIYSLSSLPLSPTLEGAGLHSPFHIFSIFFLITQVVIVLGFIRHMLRETEPLVGVERWVRLIYPLGLALLPLTHFFSENWVAPNLRGSAPTPIWPGLVVAGILVVAGVLFRRGFQVPERGFTTFSQIFSLQWFYDVVGWGYQAIGRVLTFITSLLEGEGGVLWALLLVALLVSLIVQLGAGLGG